MGMGRGPHPRKGRLVTIVSRVLARRSRLRWLRLVWATWAVTMTVAAILYAWKAADDRSAFVRWRPQILQISQGVDIWSADQFYFPNPPILPLTLYPLMLLPTMVGALLWYVLKVGMVTWSAVTLATMARGRGRPMPAWTLGLVLLLAIRPILSDLQHGNINILILFLIVLGLRLWTLGKDLSAGTVLALAIAYKVTPALFLPYLFYKRSWKTCGALVVGLVLFLLVVPSALMGPSANWRGLMSWRANIISPFVEGDTILSVQEVNQSFPGVASRLLTQPRLDGPHGNNSVERAYNLVAWEPETAALIAKGVALGFVALLAVFCRTQTGRRDDPRLLGEFALVVLTMLFVSERSWKHHFVTLLLPYVYLGWRVGSSTTPRRVRAILGGALAVSGLLMASTSSEIGGVFADGRGHEVALYYGMFFWSGLVLYVATAWRVVAEGRPDEAPGEFGDGSNHVSSLMRPHRARTAPAVDSTAV